jgi:3-hydroxybutyryl-CoA dehydratase
MSENNNKLRTFHYTNIAVGEKHSRDYLITEETYRRFLDTFEDHSPVHVDEAHAISIGFKGRVMHGAILNGFISHFIGMHFPGRYSLLLAVDLRFSNPSYIGDTVHMEAVVSQKLDSRNIIVIDATLTNITNNSLAARSRIQVMIKEQV